jgi:hypothetical protein
MNKRKTQYVNLKLVAYNAIGRHYYGENAGFILQVAGLGSHGQLNLGKTASVLYEVGSVRSTVITHVT